MNAMKVFAKSAFPFLISISLSGCAIRSSTEFVLQGNCAVTKPDHFVRLDTNARLGFDATCFNLSFVGKEQPVSIDSIHGNYKYKSKAVLPLDLSHLSQSNAVFVPTAELFVGKSPQNIVQYVRLNYGRYDLNFDYVLNGQTNSCNFNVDYVFKTKHHLSFDGFKFFWYMLTTSPGP